MLKLYPIDNTKIPSQYNSLPWKDRPFDKEKIIQINHRDYEVIAHKEKKFTCIQRVMRAALGCLIAIASLGFAFFSKSVCHLFTSKISIYFISPLDIELKKALPMAPPEENSQMLSQRLAQESIRNFDQLTQISNGESRLVTGEDVKSFAISLISRENQIKLCELKERLIADHFCEEIINLILNDWDIIGHDIRNNESLLDQNRFNEILSHAQNLQNLKDNQEEFQRQFELLKTKLSSGELPARKAIMEKYFPLLADLIQNDQQKSDLDTLLKEKAVAQELRKLPLFTLSFGERTFYHHFSLPTDQINPLEIPKSLEKKVALILLESSPLFEESESHFIQSVRSHIQNFAIEERIDQMINHSHPTKHQSLNLAKNHLKNTKTAINTLNCISTFFLIHGQSVRERMIAKNIPSDTDPMLSALMKRSIQSEVNFRTKNLRSRWIRQNCLPIYEIEKHESDFNLKTTETLNFLNNLNIDNLIKRYQNLNFLQCTWFEKWKNHFIKVYSQGLENANEALVTGVCAAKTLMLIEHEMKNPDASEESIKKIIEITPKDRFVQAFYACEGKYSQKVLKKAGFKASYDIDEYSHQKIPMVVTQLCKSIKSKYPWELTQGVISISIAGYHREPHNSWAHALYIRKDSKRGIYRLGDVNMGILKFSTEQELFECFREFLKFFYPLNYMRTCSLELQDS